MNKLTLSLILILVMFITGCAQEITKEIHIKEGTTVPTDYIRGEEAINLFVSTPGYRDFEGKYDIVRIDAIYEEDLSEIKFTLRDVWIVFAVEKSGLKIRTVIDAETSQIYSSSEPFRVE